MKKPTTLLLVAITTFASAAFAATADPAEVTAARALYDARKLPEAQQAFEKIAATDPANAEAQYFLAQLAMRRSDNDKAVAHAEKATTLAPNNALYQRTLGDTYGQSAQRAGMLSKFGLAKKCLAAYQRATELAPNDLAAHQSLFDYYRQAPGIAGGGTDKALGEAAIIKKLDPMAGRIAFATLYTVEKKYDQALAEFDEVLKTAPDDYAALYQVGKLAAVSGQHLDRGLTSLKRCLELTPPTPNSPGPAAAHWRMGQIHEHQKDPAAARAAYEASLKVDPKFPQSLDALKKLK